MKPYPLLFKPSFKERIWGGSRIKKFFCNPGLSERVGEAWVVSAHPEGKSIIMNGEFSGEPLSTVLKKCPEWFSRPSLIKFPLLVKVLDANDNLSVQVHPDDEFARRNENGENGKTECWYVIDSEPGAEIVVGHNARNRDEFIRLAKANKWDELLTRVPARAEDFFFIPSGTVHALGKGILLLEVQQSSDITYRIYDYDRIGLNGKKRDLHFEKAVDVIDFFQPANHKVKPCAIEETGVIKTVLVSCDYFAVEKWLIKGTYDLKPLDSFLLIFIVDGEGALVYEGGSILLTKSASIMIPASMGKCQLAGQIKAIVSYI